MKTFLAIVLLAATASAQSDSETQAAVSTPVSKKDAQKNAKDARRGPVGDVGTGVAKGAGSVAKGTAKGAADLATLHPIGAATSVAGGAVSAGKDVTVGTAKGAGKVTRGVGKVIRKIF